MQRARATMRAVLSISACSAIVFVLASACGGQIEETSESPGGQPQGQPDPAEVPGPAVQPPSAGAQPKATGTCYALEDTRDGTDIIEVSLASEKIVARRRLPFELGGGPGRSIGLREDELFVCSHGLRRVNLTTGVIDEASVDCWGTTWTDEGLWVLSAPDPDRKLTRYASFKDAVIGKSNGTFKPVARTIGGGPGGGVYAAASQSQVSRLDTASGEWDLRTLHDGVGGVFAMSGVTDQRIAVLDDTGQILLYDVASPTSFRAISWFRMPDKHGGESFSGLACRQ
jgi:hypothetical protein